ncbi:MAG: response regulator [Deltaproteobacteria bacterium]|nr:response regulator [Deltaproteobacteria bacterium]
MADHSMRQPADVDGGPILLVDDDPDDVELTLRALRRGRVLNPVIRTWDPDTALRVLRGEEGTNPRRPAISLVLLDLHLPGVGGWGLLAALQDDPQLRGVPVVVVSGSCSEAERIQCEQHGALAFLEKPLDVSKLLGVIGDLAEAGLYLVRLAA